MRAVEGVLHSRRDLVPHLLAPLQLEDGGVACNIDHGHRAASGRQQNAQAPIAALPSRQAAEHRRGGGREMVSISLVEGRTGGSAGAPPPGVATSRKVRAREPQSHVRGDRGRT